jgi:hypothetical protein
MRRASAVRVRRSDMTDTRPDRLAASLDEIAHAMAATTEPWWIIGSAAVVLHGVDTSVPDVDVLCGKADAAALLAALGGQVLPADVDPVFRSAVFGRCGGTPLPVEVMAGLTVRGAPVRLATREWRGGAPVPSRGELVALLRRFGRAKDLARARSLEAQAPETEQGLMSAGAGRDPATRKVAR